MIDTASQPVKSASKRRRRLITIGVLVILAAAAAGGLAWHSDQTYHLATVQDGVLYRDGAKSIRQFANALDQVHPHTVVSLVDPHEQADPNTPQFAAEAQLCANRGIKLERIEVKLGGWPASADIHRFLKIVSDPEDRPVLVHCAQGVRRTAMFVAAFQESVLGYDKARTTDAILTFGHSDRTIDDIKRFIEMYDPKTESVPEHLADMKQ